MTDVRIGMSKSKELHVFYMYDKAHFFAGNVNMIAQKNNGKWLVMRPTSCKIRTFVLYIVKLSDGRTIKK